MKTFHKVAVGGASATTAIALATAMFWHWEGHSYVVEHLHFDPPGVITVCGGVTNYDIPDLKIGQKFTEAQCQDLIAKLIPKYAAPLRKCLDDFDNYPPHRQAALISFAVNLGPGRICGTSMAKDLNAGRVTRACNKMTEYVRANGKYLKGLDRRRSDPTWGERPWCLRED